jgi:hypothetical protein
LSACSWLHLLKSWSPRQTRSGSGRKRQRRSGKFLSHMKQLRPASHLRISLYALSSPTWFCSRRSSRRPSSSSARPYPSVHSWRDASPVPPWSTRTRGCGNRSSRRRPDSGRSVRLHPGADRQRVSRCTFRGECRSLSPSHPLQKAREYEQATRNPPVAANDFTHEGGRDDSWETLSTAASRIVSLSLEPSQCHAGGHPAL